MPDARRSSTDRVRPFALVSWTTLGEIERWFARDTAQSTADACLRSLLLERKLEHSVDALFVCGVAILLCVIIDCEKRRSSAAH